MARKTDTTPTPARDPRTFSGLPPADFDALDADLLDALRATGGRTTTCPDGYTFRDTCPICD